MQCPKCNTRTPNGAKFCLNCGRSLLTESSVRCPQCRTDLPPEAKFCHSCGANVGEYKRSEQQGGISEARSRSEEGFADLLQRLLPGQYVEKLLAARGQLEGERRLVTILFSDVKGSTAMAESLDPEEVLEIMNGAFEVLIEPITRYEGTVARLMGDAILAFFGAPIAHEDDPVRACRAALDIVEGVKNYADRLERQRGVKGFNVRVGINTGLVVVAEVGADLRVEYTAMGDAVNLAARMEAAAEPGTVLITESTYKLVSHSFETEALGNINVKGRKEPVCVYRLSGIKKDSGYRRLIEGLHSPLIGRRAELDRIQSSLRSIGEGKGMKLAIIGEPGLGKSRLILEAQNSAPTFVNWAEGRALAYTQGMSYWMGRNLLYNLLAVDAESDRRNVATALYKSIEGLRQDKVPEIYPYLARLLDVPLDKGSEQRVIHLDAGSLHKRIVRAFHEYLKLRSLKEPLVLVWEDLHWIDPSSLTLLELSLPLTEKLPLLFLLVFRLDEGQVKDFHQRNLKQFGEAYQVIQLDPLTRSESTSLMENLLKLENLPSEVERQVLEKTEGNPFFLEEVLRSLGEAELAAKKGQPDSSVSPVKRIKVPDTLRGVIMARIDSLPPQDRLTLQTASVIGRIFHRNLLAHLMGVSVQDSTLENSLTELRRRDFIYSHVSGTSKDQTPPSEEEFIFKHSLTQEVAYDSLLLAQRKVLHGRAGEAIEHLFPSRSEELSGTLALHFEKAGVREKALTYLIKAAERSKRVFANQEAIAYYLRAMGLAKEKEIKREQIVSIQEGLGDVYALFAKYALALQHYEQALEKAQEPKMRAAFQRKMGQVYERWGQYDRATELLQAGLRELKKSMDVAEAARIYTGLGLVYFRREELNTAIELSTLALEMTQRLRDEWGIAEACNNLGIIYCKSGDLGKALEFHQRCLSIWERIGEISGLAASHNNLGLVYHQQGDWDKAVEHYRQSLELCEKIGNRHALARTYDNLSQAHACKGEQEEAMDSLKKAVTILGEIGVDGAEVLPEVWQQSGVW